MPNIMYISISTSIKYYVVYLSCFVKSFSKNPCTFLTVLAKPANSSGRNPSVMMNSGLSNSFRRYLAALNTCENIADTAYLYHIIGLGYDISHIVIGSSFNNDSSFKCTLMSLIGLVSISSDNNCMKSFILFGASGLRYIQSCNA